MILYFSLTRCSSSIQLQDLLTGSDNDTGGGGVAES